MVLAYGASTVQERGEELLAIAKALLVGDPTAGLEGEQEPFGRLPTPAPGHLLFGQAIEGVVDLHRIEVAGIERKPAVLGQVLRIKMPSTPLFIMPSAGAYVVDGAHSQPFLVCL